MTDHTFVISLEPAGPYYIGDRVKVKVKLEPARGTLSSNKPQVTIACGLFDPPSFDVFVNVNETNTVTVKSAGTESMTATPTARPSSTMTARFEPGASVTVKPFPTVSFDSPAIQSVVTIDGAEADNYAVGKANVKLKLSEAAPPKGAEAELFSPVLGSRKYIAKFNSGETRAVVAVIIEVSTNIRDFSVEGKKNCTTADDGAGVRARGKLPAISFAAEPFTIAKQDGKPLLLSGAKTNVKVTLDYLAPAAVKGKLTCPAFKAEAPFTIAKGAKEFSVPVEAVQVGALEPGEQTVRLVSMEGCIDGATITADIFYQEPLTVGFVEGENWVDPPQMEFCVNNEITVMLTLNRPAEAAKDYAKVQIGGPTGVQGTVNIAQGEETGSCKIKLTKYNLSAKVELLAVGTNAQIAPESQKTIKIHQENKVTLAVPEDKGPFFPNENVDIPVTLKYAAAEDGKVATLKSALFGSTTYDVEFQKGSQETTVTVKLTNIPADKKKETITLEGVTGFRLDDDHKAIELNVEKVWQLTFDGDPEPAGPYFLGDKVKFKVKLSKGAPEAETVGDLECAGAFEPVPVVMGQGESEAEVEAEFTGTPKAEAFTVSFKPANDKYKAGAKNATRSIKFIADPVMSIPLTTRTSAPITQYESYTSAGSVYTYVFRNGCAGTITVKLNTANAPQSGSKGKLTCTAFAEDVEFDISAQEIQVPVKFLKAVEDGEVKLSVVQGATVHATENVIKVKVRSGTLVQISPEADWITPDGPYEVNDEITLKLFLDGKEPTADATLEVRSDSFATVKVTIAKDKWVEGETQTFEVKAKLTATNWVRDPLIQLKVPVNCELGQTPERRVPVQSKTTAFFRKLHLPSVWTEPDGHFYQGDKFKLTVELKRPAREDGKALVKLKASEAGIFPKNADLNNEEVYEVKFEKDKTLAEVVVEIVKPTDVAQYLTAKKKIQVLIEEIAGARVYKGTDVAVDISLHPFPEAYFGTKSSVLNQKKPEGTEPYIYRVTQKPTLRIKLLEKAPQKGCKVKVVSKVFGEGKEYEVEFKFPAADGK
jgi:hypothetical protein